MDIKDKALRVIEGLTLETTEEEIPGLCYMFSHIAIGRCENPHEDWVRELDKTYRALRRDNTISGGTK